MVKNIDYEKVLLPIRRKRLYEDVEDQLMDIIKQGKLKPGDKFPSETVLKEKLNVSRAILREAFRVLETRGIVESIQGGGRYLKIPARKNSINKPINIELEASSLLDVYEVRLAIEPMAARLAAERTDSSGLNTLKTLVNELKNKDRDDEEDFRFHITIANLSKNTMLEKLIIDQINIVGSMSEEVFEPIIKAYKMEDFINDHMRIVKAIELHDGEMASLLMYKHIEKSYFLIKN